MEKKKHKSDIKQHMKVEHLLIFAMHDWRRDKVKKLLVEIQQYYHISTSVNQPAYFRRIPFPSSYHDNVYLFGILYGHICPDLWELSIILGDTWPTFVTTHFVFALSSLSFWDIGVTSFSSFIIRPHLNFLADSELLWQTMAASI